MTSGRRSVNGRVKHQAPVGSGPFGHLRRGEAHDLVRHQVGDAVAGGVVMLVPHTGKQGLAAVPPDRRGPVPKSPTP